MLIKSLDGYYKTTPEKYVDFRGVHPWQNTEDHEDHPSPLLQLDRDLMVYTIYTHIYTYIHTYIYVYIYIYYVYIYIYKYI